MWASSILPLIPLHSALADDALSAKIKECTEQTGYEWNSARNFCVKKQEAIQQQQESIQCNDLEDQDERKSCFENMALSMANQMDKPIENTDGAQDDEFVKSMDTINLVLSFWGSGTQSTCTSMNINSWTGKASMVGSVALTLFLSDEAAKIRADFENATLKEGAVDGQAEVYDFLIKEQKAIKSLAKKKEILHQAIAAGYTASAVYAGYEIATAGLTGGVHCENNPTPENYLHQAAMDKFEGSETEDIKEKLDQKRIDQINAENGIKKQEISHKYESEITKTTNDYDAQITQAEAAYNQATEAAPGAQNSKLVVEKQKALEKLKAEKQSALKNLYTKRDNEINTSNNVYENLKTSTASTKYKNLYNNYTNLNSNSNFTSGQFLYRDEKLDKAYDKSTKKINLDKLGDNTLKGQILLGQANTGLDSDYVIIKNGLAINTSEYAKSFITYYGTEQYENANGVADGADSAATTKTREISARDYLARTQGKIEYYTATEGKIQEEINDHINNIKETQQRGASSSGEIARKDFDRARTEVIKRSTAIEKLTETNKNLTDERNKIVAEKDKALDKVSKSKKDLDKAKGLLEESKAKETELKEKVKDAKPESLDELKQELTQAQSETKKLNESITALERENNIDNTALTNVTKKLEDAEQHLKASTQYLTRQEDRLKVATLAFRNQVELRQDSQTAFIGNFENQTQLTNIQNDSHLLVNHSQINDPPFNLSALQKLQVLNNRNNLTANNDELQRNNQDIIDTGNNIIKDTSVPADLEDLEKIKELTAGAEAKASIQKELQSRIDNQLEIVNTPNSNQTEKINELEKLDALQNDLALNSNENNPNLLVANDTRLQMENEISELQKEKENKDSTLKKDVLQKNLKELEEKKKILGNFGDPPPSKVTIEDAQSLVDISRTDSNSDNFNKLTAFEKVAVLEKEKNLNPNASDSLKTKQDTIIAQHDINSSARIKDLEQEINLLKENASIAKEKVLIITRKEAQIEEIKSENFNHETVQQARDSALRELGTQLAENERALKNNPNLKTQVDDLTDQYINIRDNIPRNNETPTTLTSEQISGVISEALPPDSLPENEVKLRRTLNEQKLALTAAESVSPAQQNQGEISDLKEEIKATQELLDQTREENVKAAIEKGEIRKNPDFNNPDITEKREYDKKYGYKVPLEESVSKNTSSDQDQNNQKPPPVEVAADQISSRQPEETLGSKITNKISEIGSSVAEYLTDAETYKDIASSIGDHFSDGDNWTQAANRGNGINKKAQKEYAKATEGRGPASEQDLSKNPKIVLDNLIKTAKLAQNTAIQCPQCKLETDVEEDKDLTYAQKALKEWKKVLDQAEKLRDEKNTTDAKAYIQYWETIIQQNSAYILDKLKINSDKILKEINHELEKNIIAEIGIREILKRSLNDQEAFINFEEYRMYRLSLLRSPNIDFYTQIENDPEKVKGFKDSLNAIQIFVDTFMPSALAADGSQKRKTEVPKMKDKLVDMGKGQAISMMQGWAIGKISHFLYANIPYMASWASGLNTPLAIMAMSGSQAFLNFRLSKHAGDQAKQAQGNIVTLTELKSVFEKTNKPNCPNGHDDLKDPQCYCYKDTGEPNVTERSNSQTCQALWKKRSNNYFEQSTNYETTDQTNALGCYTVSCNFDRTCECKNVTNSDGQNACMKASMNGCDKIAGGVALGDFEGNTTMEELNTELDKIYSGGVTGGNLDAGKIGQLAASMKNAHNDQLKKVNDERIKNGEDPIPTTPEFHKEMLQKFLPEDVPQYGGDMGRQIAEITTEGLSPAKQQAVEKVLEKIDQLAPKGGKGLVKKGKNNKFNFNYRKKSSEEPARVTNYDKVMNKKYNYTKNDISKDTGRNIFEIISKRYIVSGLKHIYDN